MQVETPLFTGPIVILPLPLSREGTSQLDSKDLNCAEIIFNCVHFQMSTLLVQPVNGLIN